MGECIHEFFDCLPEDKPFCLSVSFSVPHGSQTTSMFPGSAEAKRMIKKQRNYYGAMMLDQLEALFAEMVLSIVQFCPNRIQARSDSYRSSITHTCDRSAMV